MGINFFFYFKNGKWMGQLFWKSQNLTVNAKDVVGRGKGEQFPFLLFISLFSMFLGLLQQRGAQHTLLCTAVPIKTPTFPLAASQDAKKHTTWGGAASLILMRSKGKGNYFHVYRLNRTIQLSRARKSSYLINFISTWLK